MGILNCLKNLSLWDRLYDSCNESYEKLTTMINDNNESKNFKLVEDETNKVKQEIANLGLLASLNLNKFGTFKKFLGEISHDSINRD